MEDTEDIVMKAAAPDDRYKNSRNYGEEFEIYMAEQNPTTYAYYTSMDEDAKRSFAIEHLRSTNTKAIQALSAITVAKTREYDVEPIRINVSDDAEYRSMSVLARLAFLNVVPVEYLSEMPSFQWMIGKASKIAETILDPTQLNMTWDNTGAFDQYKRLVSMNADKRIVTRSLSRGTPTDTQYFSAVYYHNFTAVKGFFDRGDHLEMPDGRKVPFGFDPVTKSPVCLADAGAFEESLANLTNGKVKIVPGNVNTTMYINYFLANAVWKHDPAGLKAELIPNASYCGFFSESRKALGERLIAAMVTWSKSCCPPPNLCGGRWLHTYLHMVLDYGMRQGKFPFPADDALTAYWDVIAQDLVETMRVWTPATVKDFVMGLKKNVPFPVLGMESACAALEKRRSVENPIHLYNEYFQGTDARFGAILDNEQACIQKHDLITLWLKEHCPKPKSVDIVGFGDGTMMPALKQWNPDIVANCYDKQHRKGIASFERDNDMAYADTAEVLYDYSFGEGTPIDGNNSKIVRLAASGYACGVLKFTLSSKCKLVVNSREPKFPYGINDIFSMYNKVRLIAPGKAHTPEMFLLFAERRTSGQPPVSASALIPAYYAKAALMGIANMFRSHMWDWGYRAPIVPGIVAGGFLKDIARHLAFSASRDYKLGDLKTFLHLQGVFEDNSGLTIEEQAFDMPGLAGTASAWYDELSHTPLLSDVSATPKRKYDDVPASDLDAMDHDGEKLF